MALLGTAFFIMSVSLVSESLFHSEVPEHPGYVIEAATAAAPEATTATATAPAYDAISPLLASADVAAGANIFKKCAACHTDDKSGANKIGPNLYGVVGRPVASIESFKYSSAMKAFAEGGKSWTYEELNGFLFKPRDHVKGTAMGFAGLPKTEDRANLIGWLRTQADTPEPLPGM